MNSITPLLETFYKHPLIPIALTYLALTSKKFFSFIRLQHSLSEGGALPGCLSGFPVHKTSPKDYFKSKDKIEKFTGQVLSNEKTEICLDSNDLNNIYLKGHSINKYRINPMSLSYWFISKNQNKYFYFEIQSTDLFIRSVEYPSLEGEDGVITRTKLLTFEEVDSHPTIRRKCVEHNGRDLSNFCNGKYDFFFPLSENYNILEPCLYSSSFLFYLFGVIESPDENPERCRNEDSYKRALTIIERIQRIEIINGTLVIKAG